ncbi:MAG: hypothetical protein LBC68_11460 [Prevotellaceae bacterium]|jgi:hypothetical protein|nr:hypothetical protein [Prevotellaceae bacterium]
MKKIFILLIIAVLLNNCTGCEEEDKTIDVSVLPEETSTGRNTFGCLIDGWVYVGGRYFTHYYHDFNDTIYNHYHPEPYSILFCSYPEYDEIKVFVQLEKNYGADLRFTINNPVEGKECVLADVYFGEIQMPDGIAFITLFDKGHYIISGRFECSNRIKHGRFDVIYHSK